jgi:hypothetical protein
MKRRYLLVACALLLAFIAAGVRLVFLTEPVRAAERYLAATYAGQRQMKDVRVAVLSRSPDRVRLRLTARFDTDPDYGAADDPATWYTYSSDVDLLRHGLQWLPAQGGILSDDRTYSVFTWTATDPVTERARGAKPCT